MRIDAEISALTRDTITFKNWEHPGMIVPHEKCLEDAKLFREAVSRIASGDEASNRTKGALMILAGQYESAANGEFPRAK